MDAVILAAGRGQRMLGYSMPFFKPLLEVNGITLLAYAAEYAAAAGAEKAVVVVSPHNIDRVKKVLLPYSSWIEIVVQEEPCGPGHAALLGLKSLGSTAERSMLLMSDNIMDIDKVVNMAISVEIHDVDAIGVRSVPVSQATRFTRVRQLARGGSLDQPAYEFVEGVPFEESDIDASDPNRVVSKVWCGPVIFKTPAAVSVLSAEWERRGDATTELKIGPHLDAILTWPVHLHDVNAMDVGVPADFEIAIEEAKK